MIKSKDLIFRPDTETIKPAKIAKCSSSRSFSILVIVQIFRLIVKYSEVSRIYSFSFTRRENHGQSLFFQRNQKYFAYFCLDSNGHSSRLFYIQAVRSSRFDPRTYIVSYIQQILSQYIEFLTQYLCLMIHLLTAFFIVKLTSELEKEVQSVVYWGWWDKWSANFNDWGDK